MTANPVGNRFCESCGGQLHLTCSACGHEASLTARYCGNCGHSLLSAAAAGTAVERSPKWGELKQATVLFADVVGSTELVANLDPEQAMGRLRPAVLRMRHSIERFGGTVVRTLGDGVMALFGVPRTLEGHALLACQAALHMQHVFSQGLAGLSIRVGLHSGQVASDPEDAADGHGGGAHGLTIHLASRVIALAEPGGICLTEACRAAAGSTCKVHSIGAHRLKGIPQAVEILQLAGVGAESRAGASPPLQQTTFRGRTDELEFLSRALQRLQAGTAQVVGVTGEPGTGKSRLCHEFAQACRNRGTPVYEVRAQPYGHALPMQPVLELFRTYFFCIVASDDGATARARISARLEPLQPTAADLELLFEFFGVAPPGAPPIALGPRARQARLLARLKELIRADGDTERLILIEDMHWLDEGSEEFVGAILEAVVGTRTLLLLNYRTSYRCPWLNVPYFTQLQLSELPTAAMDAIVAELLAPLSALPDICRLICERSAGNPFFAEELVRTLADSKLLSPETGLPVGGVEAVERALPATLQAVIGARLDSLGEPEKTLVQMCAIIGKDIPLAVLEHVASRLASQIERGLEGLCHAGLILPQTARGGRRFAFRHPLIQEVAYGAQLKVRRGQVHATVAAAMELYYVEQLDEYASLVAYHHEQAGQHLSAARFMARGALWMASASSARGIRAWRKVRSLLEQCPRSSEVDRLRAFAAGKICYLGWREGLERGELEHLITDAISLAADTDSGLIQLLLFARGRLIQSSGGAADNYVENVQRALGMASAQESPGRMATLQLALSHAYAWAGMLKEALQASDAALAGLGRIDLVDREFIGFSVEQWAYGIRLRLLNRMGRLQEARECLVSLSEHVSSVADPVMRQLVHYAYLDYAWLSRDRELARHHGELVLRIPEEDASPYCRVLAHSGRAIALQVEGDLRAAKLSFHEALQTVRQGRVGLDFEPEFLAGIAECELDLGELEATVAMAREAIRAARERTNRVTECRAMLTLAAALAACGGEEGRREAASLLEDAQVLLALTGAQAFHPALLRAREAIAQAAAPDTASTAVDE
ncbi:adenylate/guanylate cyclase domain-containing protein [Ramlibacter sp.]|uniref:adenylate/guanylate cyclase domain-containing protein n=1 Tax=Ramlibacter sp. TaxID=1917967 RepID=UPI0025DDE7C5|nr:adenylate/guanylate cyclase domain-containing protein [Ramlibacter sp.]